MKRDENEEKIQEIINDIESEETIKKIQKLYSENNNLFDKPSWLKPYVVLDSYDSFIKCTLRVPGNELGSQTENYVAIDLFGKPPSYIKSFSYTISAGEEESSKATLVFEDYYNTISDILILRLEKYRKQVTPSGNIYLDIEWGYVKPNYFVSKTIDRTLKKKLKFTNTETFILRNFSVAYDGTKPTYTFELFSQNVIESTDTFYLKPYEILGPHPGLKIKLFEILYNLSSKVKQNTEKQISELEKEIKKIGIKNKNKTKELLILNEKLNKLNIEFNNLQEKMKNVNLSKIQDSASLSNLRQTSTQFKLVNDALNSFLNDPRIADLISSFSHYIFEETIHPWDLFKYCYRAMVQQFTQDSRAPVPLILSFMDGLTYKDIQDLELESDSFLNLVQANLERRIFGLTDSFKDPKLSKYRDVSQFKIRNFEIKPSTSWTSLFKEIFKYIKMEPQNLTDPKSRQEFTNKILNEEKKLKNKTGKIEEENLRKIIELFPKVDLDVFTVDTYSDLEEIKTQTEAEPVKKTRIQRILAELEKFSIKLGNLDKKEEKEPEKYIKKISGMIDKFIEKNKNRKIMYLILFEDLEGSLSPFNSGRWGNQILQAYSFKFVNKTDIFRNGITNMNKNNIPDVISFAINEYDFQSVITSINESNDVSVDVSLGGKEIYTAEISVERMKELKEMSLEERTKSLKDTGITETTFQKHFKGKNPQAIKYVSQTQGDKFAYLKVYRNNDKMNLNFSASQILTSNEDNFADVARAKRTLEVYRGMMALRASSVKANIQILGDPHYDHFCLSKYIFVKVFNSDGSLSMFTGIYRIMKIIHSLESGKFLTNIELIKANNEPEQLGDIAKVFFTKDILESNLSFSNS